jgi:hypothetical protein
MILSSHPMTFRVARIQQEQMLAEADRRRRARESRRPADVTPVGDENDPWRPFRRLRDLVVAAYAGQPYAAR